MIVGEVITEGPVSGEVGDMPAPRPGLDGADGWSIQLGRNETHLLVRQVRGDEVTAWSQVIALAELVGPAGAVPVFDIVGGALAYRFGSSGPWAQLFTLAELKGDRGLSAYEVWLGAGNVGTVLEFLTSLRGQPGPPAEITSVTAVGGTETKVETGGTPTARTLAFTIKEGRDGTSATITDFTVTQLPSNATPTVQLGGTPSARTIAIGWPAGAAGPQGAGGTPNVDLVGTGVPNGTVVGQPGTIYKDLGKTYGVRTWIKDTGTNNQGWIPLAGDTGIRDITSLQDPQYMTIATSKVTVQRFYNGNVTLAARCSAPANPTGNFNPRIYLPTGFWPEPSLNTMPGEAVLGSARALSSQAPTGFQWNWYIASGALRGFSTTAPVAMNGGFVAYATFACSQPPPTI